MGYAAGGSRGGGGGGGGMDIGKAGKPALWYCGRTVELKSLRDMLGLGIGGACGEKKCGGCGGMW